MTKTTAKPRDSEETFTPNLRFPKFRNWTGWKKTKLSDLLSEPKRRNRDLKYKASDVLSVSGEFGCVNQITHLGRSYAGASVENYHVVETGDIVYTKSPLKRNPYGIIKANKGKAGIVSTLYAVYRPTERCHADYLDHYFSRDYNLNFYLQPIVKKGPKNDMKVSNSDVLIGEIWVPELEEQKRISDCLTSLEELITTQSQKLTALKTYKIGLMRKLFPQAGEALPNLRFPEFRNAPKWKTKQFGQIFNRKTEKNIENNLNVLTISAQNGLVSQLDYFNKSVSAKDVTGYYLLRKGEFAYNKSYSQGYPMGAIKRLKHYEKGVVSTLYICFKIDEGQSGSFFEQYFDSGVLNNEIGKIAQEGARNHGLLNIGINEFFDEIKVTFPNIKEQQKIADCLSSVDDLIWSQAQKLDAFKAHKKALMQKLFPSPSEPEI